MFPPPPWLKQIANQAAQAISPIHENVPVGCHIHLQSGRWEVTVFVSAIEVIGGERDGERIVCPFAVDVLQICSLFSQLYDMTWQAADWHSEDEVGAHLSVLGSVDGKDVWLRVTARQPRELEAGQIVDITQGGYSRRW